MYEVELNINGISPVVIDNMKNIAENNGMKVFYHGFDRLVIKSITGYFGRMSKTIEEIARMCEGYGVDYVSLLDLD